MAKPSNTKELKTFLGFIQYLAKFLPNMADVSAPLRKLLEKNTAWHWERQQEDTFNNSREWQPVLSYYDPKKPVTLSVDASSKGLGAVLYQEEKPVAYEPHVPISPEKYQEFQKSTADDVVMQAVQDCMSLKMNKDKSIEETAVTCVQVNSQRKNRGVMLNIQTPKVEREQWQSKNHSQECNWTVQPWYIDSQHNPVITRSGRASKPPGST
ncbi:Hypothetical predicted protein [Paramuricea clavata]|uniref:Reverse transcriptase/retrotransposon-derived protein RNase H-like domain-containing protein n=1 Tax=Paramuricea clavata TaxID=317549 RepID=A0A6S7IV55_PARCT|nr:Hypothetical predicted protein [Paramuricea clavata]